MIYFKEILKESLNEGMMTNVPELDFDPKEYYGTKQYNNKWIVGKYTNWGSSFKEMDQDSYEKATRGLKVYKVDSYISSIGGRLWNRVFVDKKFIPDNK